jgi:O-antigen/teichoic acid export membrane protein
MHEKHLALVKGSIILLVLFNIYNIINFAFHFGMARLLTTSDYGILASLMSIIYIFGIFTEPIQTIITKYSSVESEQGKIKNFLKRSLRKAAGVSFFVFFLYLLVAIPVSIFLAIPYLLIALTGLTIFTCFSSPITRGIMQGRKFFTSLGLNMILEGSLKLILSIFLVLLGWKVYGAMTALLIASLLAFFFSFLPLRNLLRAKEKPMKTKGIYNYSWPVFIILFIVLVFYSIDIIIARAVFSPETAGTYALASILAKTIFFATQPISKAMFPLAVERKSKEKSSLLLNSIAILSIVSLCALAAIYFFSGLLIRIFTGRYIPESASILFYLAIAVTLLSFTNLILLYNLSFRKVKRPFVFLVFILIEMALLFYFSANLLQFSIAFIVAAAIFLWGSILLFDT